MELSTELAPMAELFTEKLMVAMEFAPSPRSTCPGPKVQERTAELEQTNEELHKLNRLFVGRELRMIELKERIRELEGEG